MKRFLTITGISVIFVFAAAPFLVGAGNNTVYTGDAHEVYEPEPAGDDVTTVDGPETVKPYEPSGGGIMAVVKSETGANDTIYYGELAYGAERFLLLVNGDCDSPSTYSKTDTINLTLCPGPGKYRIVYYRALGDDLDSVVETKLTNTNGEITITMDSVTRGAGILVHLDPLTPDTSAQLELNCQYATYAVNGRKVAIDPFGRIHICYTDEDNDAYSVWYARSEDGGTNWSNQKVADDACCPAIAVDNYGVPYIACRTRGNDYTKRKTIVWSEGRCDTISNRPRGQVAICIYPFNDVGMVYNASGKCLYGTSFELSSCSYDCNVTGVGIDACPEGPSCCFSDFGDAICISRWDYELYEDDLGQRNEIQPSPSGGCEEMERFKYEGTFKTPILSKHGDELWATYVEGTSIKKKIATYNPFAKANSYFFEDSSILISNCMNVNYLQMANNFPFLVMERDTTGPGGTVQKIYYSRLNADGTWSTPARVTNLPLTTYERYPHVAVDPVAHVVQIIWTQWGEETVIGTEDIPVSEDSVIVLNPNGGEEYLYMG
ncbi:hypothetical protein GF338_05775, partial [candidate division WOR-3 bacterium]|nr:hypothetical protein [candidate division WOR-3 bacterium]